MRVTYFAAIAVLAAAASGCGGAGDPLGGPYGGTVNAVRPTAGNVSAVTDPSDAAGDDASVGDDGGSPSSCANPLDPNCTLPAAPSASSTSGSAPGTQGASGGATMTASSVDGSAPSPKAGSGASHDGGTSEGGAPGSSGGGTSGAPTWSMIFSGYLAGGTIGNCSPCHGEMGSAPQGYSWLAGRGYISGTNSALAVSGSSCLSWFGGNMPPGGPRSNAKAVSDVKAWAAAGAKNN